MKNLDRPTTLSPQLGYELIQKYARPNFKKYYIVARHLDLEDCIQEIYYKFQEKNLFQKYDPQITSPNYLIAISVERWFIDQTRKFTSSRYSPSFPASLSQPIGEGNSVLGDLVGDNGEESSRIENSTLRDELIRKLPTDSRSKIIVTCEELNLDSTFSFRNLALMLEHGYTPAEISQFCLNPRSKQPVTVSRISAEIRALREYMVEFVLDNDQKDYVRR